MRRTRIFNVVPPTVPNVNGANNLRLRLRSHGSLNPRRLRGTIRTLLTGCRGRPTITSVDDVCRTSMPRCFLGVSQSGIRLVNLRLGRIFSALKCCVKRTCMGSFIRFNHVCRIGLRTNRRTRGIVSSILGLDIIGSGKRVIPFDDFARVRRGLKVSRVGQCGVCSTTSVAYAPTTNDDSKRTVRTVKDLVGGRLNNRFKCR